jgi:spermidine synthase
VRRVAVGLVLAALLLVLAYRALTPRWTVIHDSTSDFGRIRVTERHDGLRRLYLGEGRAVQTAAWADRPRHLESAYTRVAMIGLALAPPGGRVLFVGIGGGAMPMYARVVRPDAALDAVEIDPAVLDVAIRFFGFRPDSLLTAHVDDGRAFIERAAPGSWDIVVLDAFSDDEIPYALATREFLLAVRSSLAADGVVVSNLWTRNPFYDDMVATYLDVFPQVRLISVPGRPQRILLASADRPLEAGDLIAAARALAARETPGFDLPALIERGYLQPPPRAGRVLADR